MPSIIKSTTGQDYNLLSSFESSDGQGNTYTYNVPASSVKMWLDFSETPVDRSNYSAGISAISYVKTGGSLNYPIQGTADFGGGKEFNTIRARQNTPNAGHVRVDFTSTTNALTFGDGSSDSPFSISFWYNRESAYSENAEEHLIQKSNGSSREIDIRWHPNPDGSTNGAFNIRLWDGANQLYCQVFPYNEDFFEDTWSHIVVTYDGSSSHSGVKFYIDGILQSFTYTNYPSSYIAMSGVSNKLYIGATENAGSTDGTFSELAFFSEELSQNTIRAIYYATKDGSIITENSYYSGTVSNPAKDVLKTLDSRIKNIYDCGTKKSNQKSNFNDLDTISFVNRKLIGSIGVEEGKTSTPYVALNSYSNYGIEIENEYDSSFITHQVRNSFEGDIDPFNEHNKIFLDTKETIEKERSVGDLDYRLGLSVDVNQKDIIEIDLRPSVPTTFGIEKGVGSYNQNNLMVYWNNKDKKWEKIGGTYLKPSSKNTFSQSKIGFAPTSGFVLPHTNKDFNFQAAFHNWGMHVDNFGFPRHVRYEAGEDQYINVSDYICKPFVIEYIAYELDTVLHTDEATSAGYYENSKTTNFSKTDHVLSAYTFFILNERTNCKYEGDFKTTYYTPDSESLTTINSPLEDGYDSRNTNRELVAHMQALVYKNPPKDSGEEKSYGKFDESFETDIYGYHEGFLNYGLSRAANIKGNDFIDSGTSFNDSKYAYSGSLVLFSRINEDPSHESYGLTATIGGSKTAITDLGCYRNEDLDEKISNRGFSNSLKINQKNTKISFNHSLFIGESRSLNNGKTSKKTYHSNIEKGNPQIIMPGDRLIFGWQTPVPVDLTQLSDTNPSSQMTINTRIGKLKLYGSFLSDKKSKKSDDIFYQNSGISKPIGDGITDQYYIETRKELKDSYVSYEFEGELPNRESTKRESQSETIKSSIHFTNHTSENEYIYDSYLPDIYDYISRCGGTINGTVIDSPTGLKFDNHSVYVSAYSTDTQIKRSKYSKVKCAGANEIETRQRLFSKGYNFLIDPAKGSYAKDNVLGSKSNLYGMYNYNLSRSCAQFNTRHFGHFSDMIEQRKMIAHESGKSIIYPVDVKFFRKGERIKPEESTAQNIYPHAESYLPFYDGIDSVTFRFANTKDIDNISIESGMLDEISSRSDQEINLQSDLKTIIQR